MFFYISFLRPPPTSVPISAGKLSIVPQIANDLRTEFFPGTQDIFYAWHASGPTTTPNTNGKLTTWRAETTYKEIAVPLPRGVKEGQRWRLVLSAEAQTQGQGQVDMADDRVLGRRPFGVMSVPILMTRGGGGGKKQEQIERVYAFGGSGRMKMKITEQTSFDLDKKIWDSGIGLSSWLTRKFADGTLPSVLQDALFRTEPRRILELGAGTGIVSLVTAALRHSRLEEGADDTETQIITTDLESAMPLLEHNISSNEHLFPSPAARPRAETLDWGAALPEFAESGFDAIVMADVTYNTASFPALVATLSRLSTGPKPPVVLLGYKQRDEAERSLWTMARDVGIELEKLDDIPGAGGQAIEVWMSVISS